MNSQNRQRELLHTVKHHTYKVIGLHTKVNKLMSQRIGVVVHFSICQLTVFIYHSRIVRSTLCLFGKEISKGLTQVNIDILARTYFNNTLCLFVADDADAVKWYFRLSHHAVNSYHNSIGKTLHQLLGIFAVVVFNTNGSLSVNVIYKEGDGEFWYAEFQTLHL